MKSKPKRRISYPALTIAALLSAIAFIKSPSVAAVKVLGVIDGDTVVVSGKAQVRLRFIDAPEKELCGYEQAKKELERLVGGKQVRIAETVPDQYGRGMALLYTGDTLVNEKMLESGWVRFHHDTADVTQRLKLASRNAKDSEKGIFGLCQSKDVPDKPGCIIKGNIDKNSHAKIYYVPGCAQYAFTVVEKDLGEGWFCTESAAKDAGFTRAKTCTK